MQKIRYSEIFYSLQGEGIHLGTPSVFLRTFGCNFTCSGFGMKKGEQSKEREKIVVSENQKLQSLPLVSTGCDSYLSWDPRFKKYAHDENVQSLAEKLLALTPKQTWVDKDSDIHLIITGGEPLLGWQRMYSELFEQPSMLTLKNLTFETNATQKLDTEFQKYLNDTFSKRAKITWACSPKLSNSGHTKDEAIKTEIVKSYNEINNSTLFLKFVVSELADFIEVEEIVSEYRAAGVEAEVWVMPEGGTVETYGAKKKFIADEALRRGYRFSPRLHVELWRNAWGR